jgi:hypothetical protein
MRAEPGASVALRRRPWAWCAAAPLIVAAILLWTPSCTAPVYVITAGLAVAQVGTTAYANGELQTSLIVDFDAANDAAAEAQAALDLEPSARRVEGRRATISSRDLGQRSVTVEVVKRTNKVCKINIRVGFWGDQSMSRLLLSQMQKELAAKGFVPPPVTIVPSDAVEELENNEGAGDGGHP